MTDNRVQLEILRSLVGAGDAPIKGINIKIAFKEPEQWFFVLDRSELARHGGGRGAAFMVWLMDKSKAAYDDYNIKVAIHRL